MFFKNCLGEESSAEQGDVFGDASRTAGERDGYACQTTRWEQLPPPGTPSVQPFLTQPCSGDPPVSSAHSANYVGHTWAANPQKGSQHLSSVIKNLLHV